MKHRSIPAIPATIAAMVCVQSGASIAKRLFPILGPAGTSSLRIGISAILLFFINRPKLSALTRQQWLYCLLYGGCIAGMNLIFYCAIERIPLGLGVTLEFTGPLMLALVTSRKITDIVWAILATVGILLIVPWQSTSNVDPIGVGFALMAGAFWAGYILAGGKVSKVVDSKTAVSVGTCVAALIILPFGIMSGKLVNLNVYYFTLAFAVAVLSSALPFTFDMIALKKLPPKIFSVLSSLHPAIASLSGFIFLHEILTLNQWASVACVVTASIGMTLSSRKDRKLEKKD